MPNKLWINMFILIINRCQDCTGMSFGEFVRSTFTGMPMGSSDTELIEKLEGKYAGNE